MPLFKRRTWHRYESRGEPLLPQRAFRRRMASSFAAALALVCVSLAIGMAGYHFLEDMPWIDAFASASMILSGMGPLEPLKSWAGKLFAGLYALYSGLVLIVAAGVLLAPVLHRMLHTFHVECDEK